MTERNPYQPPSTDPEPPSHSKHPIPDWQIIFVGWLVGLTLGGWLSLGMPWAYAVVITLLSGATAGTLVQLPSLLRSWRES